MPTEQQDQRRERERALIVDKATAGCVADAVNQHFQESLKHVEQKVRATSRPVRYIDSNIVVPTVLLVVLIQAGYVDRSFTVYDLVVWNGTSRDMQSEYISLTTFVGASRHGWPGPD